jgi:hypothetical protein
MRHILSTALVALVVGSLAGVSVSVLAQSPAQPAPDAVTTAGLNADTVDGKHAVSAINKKSQRRNKLVATDAKGLLPSNIVKPKWPLIQQKPAAFADGQIGWNEVVGIPGPFADGVDNEGVTQVKVLTVKQAGSPIGAGLTGYVTVDCPGGFVVVGGGHDIDAGGYVTVNVFQSKAVDADSWIVWAYNPSTAGGPTTLNAYATCMRAEPAGAVIAAKGSEYGPAKVRVRKP